MNKFEKNMYQDLTKEWQNRGVQEGVESRILTNEIAKATFGETLESNLIQQEKKGSKQSHFEFLFSALGAEMTRAIAITSDAQGFEENQVAAVKGGTMAGNARKNFEKELGKSVVSVDNFLGLKSTMKNELPFNSDEIKS